MALYQELIVYGADDVTPFVTFSTDPAATFPYLKSPSSWSDTRIDPLTGTGVIGQQNMGILDRRTVLTDQATGKLTAVLSNSDGEFQLYNRRALWRQQDGVGGWDTLFDGVCGDVNLKDSLVAYAFPLRDIRERERKTKAFTVARTTSVLPSSLTEPYGTLTGGGVLVQQQAMSGGAVTLDGIAADVRHVTFGAYEYDRTPQSRWDELVEQFFRARPVYDVASGGTVYRFADVAVAWRLTSGGAWTVLENMKAYMDSTLATWPTPVVAQRWLAPAAPATEVKVFLRAASGLPANGATVDIQILSRKAPTEDMPLIVETTFGQLLKDLYDGVYSDRKTDGTIRPTGVRYNAAKLVGAGALPEMGMTCRLIKTKPADDLRDWASKNIFMPTNTAPAIINGVVEPVRCALPDAATAILTLNSANVSAEGSSWGIKGSDAINKAVVRYHRDFPGTYPRDYGVYTRWAGRNEPKVYTGGKITPAHHTSFDRLASSEVETVFIDAPSSTANREAEFVIEAETIRDVGTWDATGQWMAGDALGDLGQRIGQRLSAETIRRFRYGAMPITVRARRGDAAVKAARLGDWARVTLSWMPNLATHLRGIDELAQIVRIHITNAAWQEVELVSAGPYANALATPTLTSVTEAAGALTVTFASLAAGAAGVVNTAVNATIPAADSPLWLYAGETDGVGGLVAVTPRFGSGAVVWVRVRAEAKGRRSSAWAISGAPTAITVTIEPRILSASVDVAADGAWSVRWAANEDTLGVRVRYSVADAAGGVITALTTLGEYDALTVFDATGPAILHGHTVEVTVIPFPGWTGSAVSGAAGPSYVVQRASRPALEPMPPTVAVTVIAGGLLTKTFRITATSYFGAPEIRWRADGPFASGTFSAWTATNPLDVVIARFRSLSGSIVAEVRDANQLTVQTVYGVSAEKPGIDATTGQITEAIPTSEGHVIARGYMEGTGQNGATVDLTPGDFSSPPAISVWGGNYHEPRNASFSGGYNAALPQEGIRLGQNITDTDFDILAIQVQRGTPTAQLANFPASNLMANVAEDEELVTNPAPSNDNLYTVRYDVTVTTNQASGDSASAMVVVAIEADVGGWTEYASFPYTRSHPNAGTSTWANQVKQISVTGMTNSSKIRLYIKSFTDTDPALGSTFTVHGKEAADATDGASWTTATDSIATATPLVGTAQILVNWRAQEVSL